MGIDPVELDLSAQAEPLGRQGYSYWIDTNVMLDMSSDYQIEKNQRGGRAALDETRMNMQYALWLGVALDQVGALTVSYQHETMRNLGQWAAPGSRNAPMVAAFTWMVLGPVFGRWTGRFTKDGLLFREPNGETRPTDNDERDAFMIERAIAHGLGLITRDGAAAKKARRKNLVPLRPEEYARQIISWNDARARFFSRLETGVLAWLTRNGPSSQTNAKAASIVWDQYEAIWLRRGALL